MKISFITLVSFLLLGGSLVGCADAEYSTLETHAYLAEAEKSNGTKIIVQANQPTTTSLTVRLSDKVQNNCSFKLMPDQESLDKYNKKNGTGYIMLPSDLYTLPDKIEVKAGQYIADPASIIIKPFTEEMSNSGEQYALPLRLIAIEGNIQPMQQSGAYVIAMGSIIKFSAPVLTGSTPINVTMPHKITLNEYTVELRFQISAFYENQAFFDAKGDGANDNIYIRLEDPVSIWNLIQIKLKGTYLNAITPYEKNKWQHLAISFSGGKVLIYVNGKLDAQKEVNGDPIVLNQIRICSSGTYFRANCLFSEVRLWSKALNETQIQNNMTVVSPNSDGLEAYWKMNEGTGNEFKDATGHGFDGKADGKVRWIHDILSTDESTPWN